MRSRFLLTVALVVVTGPALVAFAGSAELGQINRPGVEGVTAPELIPESHVAPEYPAAALDAGITGHVFVTAVVGPDGTVADVRVLDTSRARLGFEQAAIDAVSKWRFEPAKRDGAPVASYRVVRLDFGERPLGSESAEGGLHPMSDPPSSGAGPVPLARRSASTAGRGTAATAVSKAQLPPTRGLYERAKYAPPNGGYNQTRSTRGR